MEQAFVQIPLVAGPGWAYVLLEVFPDELRSRDMAQGSSRLENALHRSKTRANTDSCPKPCTPTKLTVLRCFPAWLCKPPRLLKAA